MGLACKWDEVAGVHCCTMMMHSLSLVKQFLELSEAFKVYALLLFVTMLGFGIARGGKGQALHSTAPHH